MRPQGARRSSPRPLCFQEQHDHTTPRTRRQTRCSAGRSRIFPQKGDAEVRALWTTTPVPNDVQEEKIMESFRQRLAREEGFTLIELLIVIVIIGILLAIAVPSYLGFRDRANQKAANSDVRAVVPAAEAYYSDCGTYDNVAANASPGCDDSALQHTLEQAAGTGYVDTANLID